MSITKIKFNNFTAFKELTIDLTPGINVFVGENGTGKTHIMKFAYAACDISKTKLNFAEKLNRVFLPSGRQLGRLVTRQRGTNNCVAEISRSDLRLKIAFSNHAILLESAKITGATKWYSKGVESVFIPVKEMLSNGPGFRSLYSQREIHFEEIFSDILDRAYNPAIRGPADTRRKRLLDILHRATEGKVSVKNEEFFLRSRQGNIEFTLLAEGLRKLGLLWLLIQNGTLTKGAVLFWDEPGSNLNPKLFGPLIEILLELQRSGVQVFLATHDYVILRELDFGKTKKDKVLFHSLYRDSETGDIRHNVSQEYSAIHPNAIADTFGALYDREIERSLGGILK